MLVILGLINGFLCGDQPGWRPPSALSATFEFRSPLLEGEPYLRLAAMSLWTPWMGRPLDRVFSVVN